MTHETQQQCVYCPRPATTHDHVPPKSLYTPPLPQNVVTVPACDPCNNRASKDDEIFRNELSIMAGSFGESANAAERLQPTMRSILRNRATRTRMVTSAQLVERYSTGGIYLGHGYAVPLVPGLQQRVITRIVRGLHWHHFQNRLAEDAVKLVFIDRRKPQWRHALEPLLKLRHVLIGDGKTFQYVCGGATDDPTFSAWLLIFFNEPAEQIIMAHTRLNQTAGP